MRLLVLGASGFIGGAVYRLAKSRGLKLYGTSFGTSSEFLSCDIREKLSIDAAIKESLPNVIVHAAAVGATAGTASEGEIREVNVLGTLNLLDSLYGRGDQSKIRLINVGSSRSLHSVVSDETRGGTGPGYSSAKAESSRYVLDHLNRGGSGVDFAVHNTYGPGQPQGRFVGKLISRAVERREMEILNPLQVHDFVHVDDVARGILAGVLSRVTPENSIELGTGLGTSVKELANTVYDLADAPRSLIKETFGVTPGEGEIAQTHTAHDLFGWRAEISLRDGLKQMIELAKA